MNVDKLREWGYHKSKVFLKGLIHAVSLFEDSRLEVGQKGLFTMKTGALWEALKSELHLSE